MKPTEHLHPGPSAVASRNFLVVLALLFAPAIACSLNPQPFPPENDTTAEFDAGGRGQDAATGASDAGPNDSVDAAAIAPDGGNTFDNDGSVETPDGASDGGSDGSVDGASDAATDATPSDASVRD